MLNGFKTNNHGTALFMTLLILTSILVVALGAANLVVLGIKISRMQERSTKAYFAAEAGAERSLWEVRKNNYILPDENQDNIFEVLDLGNGSAYHVDYATSSPNIIFTSTGVYRGVRRVVEVNFNG